MNHFEMAFSVSSGDIGLERELEFLKSRNIKWVATDGMGWWRQQSRKQDKVEKTKKLIDEYGFKVTFYHLCGPFYSLDSKYNENCIKEVCKDIDQAAILAPNNLIIHYGWPYLSDNRISIESELKKQLRQYGQETVDNLQIEALKMLSEHASKYNINITLEGVPANYPCGGDTEHLKKLVDATGYANCGICLDSGHHNTWGKKVDDEVLKAGCKLFETHFHDNFGTKPNPHKASIIDHHNPVGLGLINWVKVIRNLQKINFDKPISFEGPRIMSREVDELAFEDFKRSVDITINNWRAFEDLADLKEWI